MYLYLYTITLYANSVGVSGYMQHPVPVTNVSFVYIIFFFYFFYFVGLYVYCM